MVDLDTARRIALSLPDAEEGSEGLAVRFHVRGKQFAWTYLERLQAKQPRQPRLDVLAIRCAAEAKQGLLDSDPDKFFTADHYRGFPAVLVRLDHVDAAELAALLTAAWRCQAPRALVRRLEGRGGG